MKEFIIENWQYLSQILLALIILIIGIFKKSSSIQDTALEIVITKLPSLIRSAEATCDNGENKKLLVLESAIRLYHEFGGSARTAPKKIDSAIEDILNTPLKKENTL